MCFYHKYVEVGFTEKDKPKEHRDKYDPRPRRKSNKMVMTIFICSKCGHKKEKVLCAGGLSDPEPKIGSVFGSVADYFSTLSNQGRGYKLYGNDWIMEEYRDSLLMPLKE